MEITVKMKKALMAGTGAAAVVTLLTLAGEITAELSWLMAPFGASLVILFALPESPLAQPRNVVGGHLLTTVVGLSVMTVSGVNPLSLGLAAGIALALMMLTSTLHPPAGANPLLVMLSGKSWAFLFSPVLCGAVLMVLLAWLYHRLQQQTYPQRWH
ncbi:MAG: HPP family protein [Marinobacterium sp.]|nr:HPP family protein [Marinobacterium sp.]